MDAQAAEVFRRKVSLRTDAGVVECVLQLSSPFRDDLGPTCWGCRVFLSEVMLREHIVYGVDEIDAIANSIRYLKMLIAKHKEMGWKIWWIEEGDDGCL